MTKASKAKALRICGESLSAYPLLFALAERIFEAPGIRRADVESEAQYQNMANQAARQGKKCAEGIMQIMCSGRSPEAVDLALLAAAAGGRWAYNAQGWQHIAGQYGPMEYRGHALEVLRRTLTTLADIPEAENV